LIHHQLPIHKTASQLLGLAARVHAQMPRGYKRTVGDKIVAHCTEMLDLMAMANASRGTQREQCLRDILREQRAATVWFRVGLDLRAIATTAWGESVQLLDSVGKQANGWMSKTREKAPAA
jgi:hypothetical protein